MIWFARAIANHPCVILVAVTVFSTMCIVLSFTTQKLPDFSDPQLGFEARGTYIGKRMAAWENLIKATGPRGPLVVNPKEKGFYSSEEEFLDPKDVLRPNQTIEEVVEETNPTVNDSDIYCEDEWRCLETHELADLEEHHHLHLAPDGFFCSELSPDYAHVVFANKDGGSLLRVESIHSMCRLEETLLRQHGFDSLCETIQVGKCCHSWSLGNYMALLHNRTSCFQVTEEDVNDTLYTLQQCAHLYHNMELTLNCQEEPILSCRHSPPSCTSHNAVYNMLHYLTDFQFLPPEGTNKVTLKYTAMFLPIAKSSAALEWYKEIEKNSFSDGVTEIVAMDLGLKSVLFRDCLLRDTFLILTAGVCILLFIWIYTNSLFITVMTVIAIVFSLGISYFLYSLVFEIKFFPFVNLLAIVVSVGIGCDGTFIYCKVWHHVKLEKNSGTLVKLVNDTLHHAALSMFVSALTTAAAFYASFVSSITAIRCFSIFAGTTILTNFLLMVTWIPASVVLSSKWCAASICVNLQPLPPSSLQGCSKSWTDLTNFFSKAGACFQGGLIWLVARLRFLWVAFFLVMGVFGVLAVFYYPKLQLPASEEFQLFSSWHPFERYALFFRERFRFERAQRNYITAKLPLRFVWGVKPEDNGDYLNPASRGGLELDPTFNIAKPESQAWLLHFCHSLQTQSFYQPTEGALLPNCFIERFKSWMEGYCKDINNLDRTPCCENSTFPFPEEVFNICVIEVVKSLYGTPEEFYIPGVEGPKFDRKSGRVKVVVVEFDSNQTYSFSYTEMHRFYHQAGLAEEPFFFNFVESWLRLQLSTAPPEMRNGFFVSHLHFYDLQQSLAADTSASIVVAIAVSLLVLLLTTLNFLVSIYAILAVSGTIFAAVGTLVALGWQLNVLESVAVTVAVGLAVDFPLHYGVQYQLAQGESRGERTAHSLEIMGNPIAMAAFTTFLAGVFMLPSSVLAYIQVGTFIVVLMTSSWFFSTFFLCSLLSIGGPQGTFGQFHYPSPQHCLSFFHRCCCCCSSSPSSDHVDKTAYSAVLSESNLSTSSTTCPLATLSLSESHELEPLAIIAATVDSQRMAVRHKHRPRSVSLTNPPSLRGDSGAMENSDRKVSLPTEVMAGKENLQEDVASSSATTILMVDDLDLLEASHQVLVETS